MKKICPKHGEYESEIIEIFGTRIECKCPKCEEEEQENEQKVLQSKMNEYKKQELLERGIEPEFFNVKLSDYKAENPSEKKALEACENLLEGKLQKILLLGSNGTGKTMLADALALKLGGIRITMYELSAKIRQGYNNGRGELDILDGLLKYPFIAIDEMGRTKGSDAEMNWLSYLIDKAHTRGIRMLLISNKLPASKLPKEKKMEAIENYLPNDSISRLRQNSIIVEVSGRDRRAPALVAV